ncbi:MAG: carboxypeptidase regulatory-like domain-containing protein [Candidatus Bathyarchaeia archaeon]
MPTLIVKVVDVNTKKPIPATIALQTTVTPTPTSEAHFTDVPPGTYQLTVSAPNYTTQTKEVTITGNQIITIELVPKAYFLSFSKGSSEGCATCPKY